MNADDRFGRCFLGMIGLLGLGACGEQSSPSVPPVPVVQVALSSARLSQVALVQWPQEADGPITSDPDPVPAALVDLALRDAGGTIHPLVADAGNPGSFRTELGISPGATYTLVGTVSATGVSGTTSVPDLLALVQPATDTITFPVSCVQCELVVQWSAPGVAILEGIVERETASGYQLVAGFLTHEAMDTVLLPGGTPGSGRLTFIAHDSAAAAFLFTNPSVGNLAGVLGFLGSQAVATRVIRWQ